MAKVSARAKGRSEAAWHFAHRSKSAPSWGVAASLRGGRITDRSSDLGPSDRPARADLARPLACARLTRGSGGAHGQRLLDPARSGPNGSLPPFCRPRGIAEVGEDAAARHAAATRYRRPVPIIFVILLATLANHARRRLGRRRVAGLAGAGSDALDCWAPVHRHGRLVLIADKADEGPKAAAPWARSSRPPSPSSWSRGRQDPDRPWRWPPASRASPRLLPARLSA